MEGDSGGGGADQLVSGGAIQDPLALGGLSHKELKRSQIQPLLFPLRHLELMTCLVPGAVTLQFEAGILPSPLSLCLMRQVWQKLTRCKGSY